MSTGDTRFVDGLRALSALAVVVFHAVLFTGHAGDVEASLPGLFALTRHGYLAVAVFIVLSGYVLMLPVARTGQSRLPGGTVRFLRRRARRILPPYWAALACSLALIAVVPALQAPAGTEWDSKVPFDWQTVAAHVLLVHDLEADWVYKINGPMWSVAVEVQIYLLMPLVLLPLWRATGRWGATTIVVAASFSAFFTGLTGAFPHPWFVGLFAMGMLAADYSVRGRSSRWAGPLLAATGGLLVFAPEWATVNYAVTELLVGATCATGLVWLSAHPRAGVVTMLHARPLLAGGRMSYSLYLIHSPLLAVGNLALLPLGLPLGVHAAVMLLVVVPFTVLAAFGFYLAVERHFLTQHQGAAPRLSGDPEHRQARIGADRERRSGVLEDRQFDVVAGG